MSWLRRLSRDRTSKAEPDLQPPEDMNGFHPTSSIPYTENNNKYNTPTKDSQYPATPTSNDMLRRSNQDQRQWSSPAHDPINSSNGATPIVEAAPDHLIRAFNEALKPYHDRIALLQSDLDGAHQTIQALEAEKAAMHNWIDKRGLRPDLPPELSAGLATNSPVAASTLATQLERKMTMLNYSLHHLADALPTPPPTSTVTSSLSALLPSITHLNSLPAGPAFAFEALIKLAGNLNSHSTGEETEADRAAIAEFYTDLDNVMTSVVSNRLLGMAEGKEDWDVSRDVKRLEKTGAFLRKEMGVLNYFLRSLEIMKRESRNAAVGAEAMTRNESA